MRKDERRMSNVLVVDDSRATRQQLRGVLESEGHTVAEAEDGLIGLRAAQAKNYDLIILDLNMPNMNGIEMTKEYRAAGKHADVPILLLTTEGAAGRIREGKEAGVNAWIVKPFKAPQLLQAVSWACENKTP